MCWTVGEQWEHTGMVTGLLCTDAGIRTERNKQWGQCVSMCTVCPQEQASSIMAGGQMVNLQSKPQLDGRLCCGGMMIGLVELHLCCSLSNSLLSSKYYLYLQPCTCTWRCEVALPSSDGHTNWWLRLVRLFYALISCFIFGGWRVSGAWFPCSHQHPTPDSIHAGFCCCRLHVVKKRAKEGSKHRERENRERVRVPGGLGGSVANTVNSRQGSAALLNSLYDCQGGCENSTCW